MNETDQEALGVTQADESGLATPEEETTTTQIGKWVTDFVEHHSIVVGVIAALVLDHLDVIPRTPISWINPINWVFGRKS